MMMVVFIVMITIMIVLGSALPSVDVKERRGDRGGG
jgi:hypothetical protein